MLSEKTIKLLEFDKIREAVASYATSAKTRLSLEKELPTFNKHEIERSLLLTNEAMLLLNKYLIDPLIGFDDVGEILEKARVGVMLGFGELLKIGKLLKSARLMRSSIAASPDDIALLKDMVLTLVIDNNLEQDISKAIISEHEINDRASEALYSIRRKISASLSKLTEKLSAYTRNNDSSKYLQDNLVTIREGRYVLPVKAECRSKIPGLVHDRSATGSTVFVEPLAVVELNNELRLLKIEEQSEIEKILRDFTNRVALGSDQLFICLETCTTVDIVLCKAKYSTAIKGVLPTISDKNRVNYMQARHPLIAADKVVPVDISIGDDFGILLITGPNAGGKTVSLKIVGLFCLMAYFGLFLPCLIAETPIFDNVFCDIGDEQSIENELSTFSSHVASLKYITENVTANSLVLLDEVGGGTDPEEGAALAVGILKYLEAHSVTGIVTTHYGELKEYAMLTPYVENACMQFNESTLMPTFKLITGMPGTSNAIKIAKRLGLDTDIISEAENALSDDKIKFELILSNAERIKREAMLELERVNSVNETIMVEKAQLEVQKNQLDTLLERIRSNAAAETRRLIAGSIEQANEILDEMKREMKEANEASILRAAKLKNKLEDLSYSYAPDHSAPIASQPLNDNEIVTGMKVIVRTLSSEGVIVSVNIKKKEAEVAVGQIKTKVAFGDLGKPIPPKTTKPTSIIKGEKLKSMGEKASSGFSECEVMVIGKTVSEAIQIIEPLIFAMFNEDDAKLLRIVHGKGTGALGKGIQAFLKACTMVSEFRYGRYGEGDSGVTIATVK